MVHYITEEEIQGVLLEVIGIVHEARCQRKEVRIKHIDDAIFNLKTLEMEIAFKEDECDSL